MGHCEPFAHSAAYQTIKVEWAKGEAISSKINSLEVEIAAPITGDFNLLGFVNLR